MALINKLFISILLCSSLSLAFAQSDATSAQSVNEIEAARTLLQTERKILIMREISLTGTEAEKFWPLFDEYSAEMKKVGDLRVKVITEYSDNYMTMTDEIAKQLLDDSLKFEEQKLKLKKKYVKKFRSILPQIKTTRFFQLDNKLDAIVNYQLASEIPLME